MAIDFWLAFSTGWLITAKVELEAKPEEFAAIPAVSAEGYLVVAAANMAINERKLVRDAAWLTSLADYETDGQAAFWWF